MSPQTLTSERLILQVEQEAAAALVLNLYQRNKPFFEQYEPTRPAGFYTLDYHKAMLRREYSAYRLGQFLRYYIYRADCPDTIIGSLNFNFFSTGLSRYTEVGYKIDFVHQSNGYAYEACRTAFPVVQQHYGIHRFDARIHPDNLSSVRLAEKLGFVPYRFEPASAEILGKKADIMRYSVTISDTQ